jgi:hypothetical protein
MKLIGILLILILLLIGCGQNRENVVPGTANIHSDFNNHMDAECRAKNFTKYNPITGNCQ